MRVLVITLNSFTQTQYNSVAAISYDGTNYILSHSNGTSTSVTAANHMITILK